MLQQRRILQNRSLFENVCLLAKKSGWTLASTSTPSEEQSQATWRIDLDNYLHYIDDGEIGFRYVIFSGPSATELAESASSELRYVELDVLLDIWRASQLPEHFITVIPMLGIAAPPQHHSQVFSAIKDGMFHEDENVRLASIWAAAATAWKEWVDLLLILARDPSSPAVRQAASDLLRAFQPWSPSDFTPS